MLDLTVYTPDQDTTKGNVVNLPHGLTFKPDQ